VLQLSCPSGNEEPRPEPPEIDDPLDDGAADHAEEAGPEVEDAAQNWAAETLELVAADDQVEVEEEVDVDVEVDVHVEVGVVGDAEQALAGAVPSAHFKSPSAIPAHTSSAEIKFPLSS
jgi:hypothetical protein